jgi:excinuclease ABC subunit A
MGQVGTSSPYYLSLLTGVTEAYGFSMNTPVECLSDEQARALLYGSQDQVIAVRRREGRSMHVHFEGVIPNLKRRYHDTDSDYMRSELEQYMSSVPCTACGGDRLKPESVAVLMGGRSIVEVTHMPIRESARDTLPQLWARARWRQESRS